MTSCYSYLKTPLGKATIVAIKGIITSILNKLSITEPTAKDKGRIMKELMPQVKGKADGKLVNDLVTALFH